MLADVEALREAEEAEGVATAAAVAAGFAAAAVAAGAAGLAAKASHQHRLKARAEGVPGAAPPSTSLT